MVPDVDDYVASCRIAEKLYKQWKTQRLVDHAHLVFDNNVYRLWRP